MFIQIQQPACWILFDITSQETPVEVTADCVIDKSFLSLWFSTRLVLEHNVIIPSPLDLKSTLIPEPSVAAKNTDVQLYTDLQKG